MNDSPGWASPGSSPSEPAKGAEGSPADDASRTPPPEPPGAGRQERPGEQPDGPDAQPGRVPGNVQPGKWSAEQPPASAGGGWGAAPPPPGGPGHPAPGQPPGWGAWNQWGRPPAAKPGVIPLRPLGVGEILDGAVSTARAHWRTALGVALGVAVLVQLASTVANGIWLRGNDGLEALENNPQPSTDELLDAMSASFSSAGITLLATLVGTVIATAMLTIVVSRAVLGRTVSMSEAWRASRPQLGRMLGLTVLVMLIVTGSVLAGTLPGIVLLAAGATVAGSGLLLLGMIGGAVCGIWLWIRYCLAAPALMLERQSVTTALRRSAKLVRNSWWRIFGIQVLAWLLVQIVSLVVQIPSSVLASVIEGDGLRDVLSGSLTFSWTYLIIVGIGGVLAMTVTLPLSAGITALLYMDQRIRREALDLELARAAGVDASGSPPPGPAGS